MLSLQVVDSVGALAPDIKAWDDLAVACGRPMSAPAWMLAWWRHLAPPSSLLRVVLVKDGRELVGVLPLHVHRRRGAPAEYRVLGTSHRADPLALPGREAEVIQVAARTIATQDPPLRILRLESVDRDTGWADALAAAWTGRLRPKIGRRQSLPAPTISIGPGSFDAWIDGKSSHFRQALRRGARALKREGAILRLSTASELDRDIATLTRLHISRWGSRSSVGARGDSVQRMMRDAGRSLVALGRLRLWCIDIDGATVSAQLFLSGGGEVSYWGGGWDPVVARMSPAMQTILAAVEDAFSRGDRRIDLGGGAQPYKLRFADGDAPLISASIIPRGPSYPVVMVADRLARERVSSDLRSVYMRLSPSSRARLKSLLGRRRNRYDVAGPPTR